VVLEVDDIDEFRHSLGATPRATGVMRGPAVGDGVRKNPTLARGGKQDDNRHPPWEPLLSCVEIRAADPWPGNIQRSASGWTVIAISRVGDLSSEIPARLLWGLRDTRVWVVCGSTAHIGRRTMVAVRSIRPRPTAGLSHWPHRTPSQYPPVRG
jgi:hypothetical protein